MRFWLERGVDGFRLDTVNFYFHDKLLRSDPADYRRKDKPDWNPYAMQYHIFSKNQPENLAFLERMRALLDEFDARTMVGEMGEDHHPIRMMGEYTSGKRLHMCYSFEMLKDPFSATHFRTLIEEFYTGAPNGWPCWAFSNHDVVRHATRWKDYGVSNETLAKQAGALLLSLQGSICMYEGEELGQTESDLDYSELTDPQGLRFWPENKGRDGCRTPMVWDANKPNAGFSDAKPWLPVKPEQAAHSVAGQVDNPNSALNFYKKMLRFRKASDALKYGATSFLDTKEPILAYLRAPNLLCVFNLSPTEQQLTLNGQITEVLAEGLKLDAGQMSLAGNGFAFFEVAGEVSIS
jgi:alpha-glucosidase